MAKFQPKIYSLSTLNIRQHFNCDYRFNDFRTDFSGESGSGKSLIADFIQLLLVGSRVFKSGTEGVSNRDTSGLVLKNSGSKYDEAIFLSTSKYNPANTLLWEAISTPPAPKCNFSSYRQATTSMKHSCP